MTPNTDEELEDMLLNLLLSGGDIRVNDLSPELRAYCLSNSKVVKAKNFIKSREERLVREARIEEQKSRHSHQWKLHKETSVRANRAIEWICHCGASKIIYSGPEIAMEDREPQYE